jgi:hypothetical protein
VVGQGKESVRRKVLGAKPKQAGKKEGGWGEGIFARLLPFPFRLSKGKAEGGFGGNSAFPLLNKNEASPATLQFIARHHRKILFSLGEKEIRRAQNEKSKEYFSVVWRAERAVAGLASLVWFRSAVFDKMSSSQTVKTHQNLTFRKLTDFFVGGAQRRPLILWGGNAMLFGALTRASLPAKTRFASRAILILSRIYFAQ